MKSEIETALSEAKAAVESGDADNMQQKTAALTQAAMKLGQAIYDQGQQQAASPGADAGATGGDTAGDTGGAAEEDVVDAEFSEVDDEQKNGR